MLEIDVFIQFLELIYFNDFVSMIGFGSFMNHKTTQETSECKGFLNKISVVVGSE